LAASTTYRVLVDKAGAQYTSDFRNPSGTSFPIDSTGFQWTGSFDTGGSFDADGGYQVTGISLSTGSSGNWSLKVQTNTITLDGNVTQYSLYSTVTTTGAGQVLYDISFDNGATWKTNKALNTVIADVGTGTQCIIKILLNGGASDTATAADYALMVWY